MKCSRRWPRNTTSEKILTATASLANHPAVFARSTPRGRILFVSPEPRALEYPRDFLSREPETLAWIDGFRTPCVYWDIGANVGSYALYAGLRPDVMTYAFEPSPSNYLALCRNVYENGRETNIRAYCLALDDRGE